MFIVLNDYYDLIKQRRQRYGSCIEILGWRKTCQGNRLWKGVFDQS